MQRKTAPRGRGSPYAFGAAARAAAAAAGATCGQAAGEADAELAARDEPAVGQRAADARAAVDAVMSDVRRRTAWHPERAAARAARESRPWSEKKVG